MWASEDMVGARGDEGVSHIMPWAGNQAPAAKICARMHARGHRPQHSTVSRPSTERRQPNCLARRTLYTAELAPLLRRLCSQQVRWRRSIPWIPHVQHEQAIASEWQAQAAAATLQLDLSDPTSSGYPYQPLLPTVQYCIRPSSSVHGPFLAAAPRPRTALARACLGHCRQP